MSHICINDENLFLHTPNIISYPTNISVVHFTTVFYISWNIKIVESLYCYSYGARFLPRVQEKKEYYIELMYDMFGQTMSAELERIWLL